MVVADARLVAHRAAGGRDPSREPGAVERLADVVGGLRGDAHAARAPARSPGRRAGGPPRPSSTPSTETRGAVTRSPAARRRSVTCSIDTAREATGSSSGMTPDSAHPHLVEHPPSRRSSPSLSRAAGRGTRPSASSRPTSRSTTPGGVVLDPSRRKARDCTQDANKSPQGHLPRRHSSATSRRFDGNNDGLSEQVCFHTGEVDMGDGTNNFQGPACTQPLVVQAFGGSGEDSFSGSDNTSPRPSTSSPATAATTRSTAAAAMTSSTAATATTPRSPTAPGTTSSTARAATTSSAATATATTSRTAARATTASATARASPTTTTRAPTSSTAAPATTGSCSTSTAAG